MAALIHELPPVVLPVYVHEHGGKLLHLRGCHRRAAYAAAALAVGADAPLQNKLIAVRVYLVVGKPLLSPSEIKHRRDDALFRAPAHKLTADPLAEDSTYRVDDDGFARARLAGEHVQPRCKADVSLFNHGYILNVKLIKHTALPLSPYGNANTKTTALSRERSGARHRCRAWR